MHSHSNEIHWVFSKRCTNTARNQCTYTYTFSRLGLLNKIQSIVCISPKLPCPNSPTITFPNQSIMLTSCKQLILQHLETNLLQIGSLLTNLCSFFWRAVKKKPSSEDVFLGRSMAWLMGLKSISASLSHRASSASFHIRKLVPAFYAQTLHALRQTFWMHGTDHRSCTTWKYKFKTI